MEMKKTTGGRRRSREIKNREEEEEDERRKEEKKKKKKKGVCLSRLISALFASVTAPSAGSSHTNRQAIWLHYETHTNTHHA